MTIDENLLYVERHFWTLSALAEAAGTTPDRVHELIEARCAPAPIYILGTGGWWSALDRHNGPIPDGRTWYARGAAWGLRRALIAARNGCDDQAIAELLERDFTERFLQALDEVAHASLAFPSCFSRRTIDRHTACGVAREEWNSWLDGGYGVCLRIFTGRTCVEKEALGAAMKAALAAGSYDADALLVSCEAYQG